MYIKMRTDKFSQTQIKILKKLLPYSGYNAVMVRANELLVEQGKEPISYEAVRSAMKGIFYNHEVYLAADEMVKSHVSEVKKLAASYNKELKKSNAA